MGWPVLLVAYGDLTHILCDDNVIWDVTPYGLMEVTEVFDFWLYN
jgi:hypothetical protein